MVILKQQTFCVIDNVGIDENNLFGLTIFPNPNNGQLNINFNNEQNDAFTVYVTDLSGRIIYTSNIASSILSIDLGNTANGTYMLHLTNGNSQVTKKIVVQK